MDYSFLRLPCVLPQLSFETGLFFAFRPSNPTEFPCEIHAYKILKNGSEIYVQVLVPFFMGVLCFIYKD